MLTLGDLALVLHGDLAKEVVSVQEPVAPRQCCTHPYWTHPAEPPTVGLVNEVCVVVHPIIKYYCRGYLLPQTHQIRLLLQHSSSAFLLVRHFRQRGLSFLHILVLLFIFIGSLLVLVSSRVGLFLLLALFVGLLFRQVLLVVALFRFYFRLLLCPCVIFPENLK